MSLDKEYTIDGNPVSYEELIQFAKDNGYYNESGLYKTSIAAAILRKLGYDIDYNKQQ